MESASSTLKFTSRSILRALVFILATYFVIICSWIHASTNSFAPNEGNAFNHNNHGENWSTKTTIESKERIVTSITKSMTKVGNARNSTITVAVASTVTGCDEDQFFIDAAAVLKYSLDRQSAKHNDQSRYLYDSIIFYHPDAKHCVEPLLQSSGHNNEYRLIETPTPIKVSEIQGDGELRERIVKNGCCGEKELIKLESYRLTQYPIVIHTDLDVIINKPMDPVLDIMLETKRYKSSQELLSKVPIMWKNNGIPDDIEFIFTKDYNVVAPRRHDKPYQGGFFIVKPSLDVYDKFISIVRSGDYDVKKGWGSKVGPFYGGMTIQGLFPWYYQYLQPGKSLELNRCIYNNMNDIPYLERNNGKKICRTNEKQCEDCRFVNATDVVTFHFTICQKPWSCLSYKHKIDRFELCREMNRLWYTYRSELEISWGRSGNDTGNLKPNHYRGFCSKTGTGGYRRIQQPYYQVV